jgi:hypothetical protein
MRKIMLFLSIFLLLIPSVLADVNVSVNVTPSTTTTTTLPPPQAPLRLWTPIIALILGAGAVLQLFATFVAGTDPMEKINLIIGGSIIFVLIIVLIGMVLAI